MINVTFRAGGQTDETSKYIANGQLPALPDKGEVVVIADEPPFKEYLVLHRRWHFQKVLGPLPRPLKTDAWCTIYLTEV